MRGRPSFGGATVVEDEDLLHTEARLVAEASHDGLADDKKATLLSHLRARYAAATAGTSPPPSMHVHPSGGADRCCRALTFEKFGGRLGNNLEQIRAALAYAERKGYSRLRVPQVGAYIEAIADFSASIPIAETTAGCILAPTCVTWLWRQSYHASAGFTRSHVATKVVFKN